MSQTRHFLHIFCNTYIHRELYTCKVEVFLPSKTKLFLGISKVLCLGQNAVKAHLV